MTKTESKFSTLFQGSREVKAVAELLSFDGRKAEFKVEAYDETGLIGEGTHQRFTIKIDKFMEKANERKINN